uniref:Spindle assembly abnormal protein 6 N-terminal domain-containing protein n=1 Tax=Timema monikensis TaxID=170555 RepID=A0A7R9HRX7_9NEOP|nr:unnamed protein product [Timema monikensis]
MGHFVLQNHAVLKNLSLKLTDDDDPLFLHVLMITEEDFKSLKSQQGLLVDFDHFPSQLVRLLEQCHNANDNSASRFLLILEEEERESVLDGGRTCLKIVETNNFKPLVHLSLKIGGGSDAEIKKFMAANIKQLKEVVSRSEKQLSRSESQLAEAMRKLSTKCKEVEQLHQQWNQEKTEFHVRHMAELAQGQDKLAQAELVICLCGGIAVSSVVVSFGSEYSAARMVQLDWQKKHETEKQELEERHSHVTKELENQINNLKLQNQILFEKQCQSDSVNRLDMKLLLVRLDMKLLLARLDMKLLLVRLDMKLLPVRLDTKLLPVRLDTKLLPVRLDTKLLPVRLDTKLLPVKLLVVRLDMKLLLVRLDMKLLPVREQSKQLELLEKELNHIQRECASLRQQNVKLDTDYHEKEKVINSLNTRTAVLEQEVKDKVILLNKQQELLRSSNQQKAHLEESLAEKDRSLQRKQVSLRSLSDELVKANEILTKLQAELSSTNSKLKLRTSIALEQEHLLDTKQKELYTLQVQCSEQTERIKHLEAQEKQLSEALQDANMKLQDKDKLLKNNDNVINWLNRRLNESQSQFNPLQHGGPILGIGPAASTPLGGLPAPTASAVAKNIQLKALPTLSGGMLSFQLSKQMALLMLYKLVDSSHQVGRITACKQAIPIERLLYVGEDSANIFELRVSWGQHNEPSSLLSQFSRLKRYLFIQKLLNCPHKVDFGSVSDPLLRRQNWKHWESNPELRDLMSVNLTTIPHRLLGINYLLTFTYLRSRAEPFSQGSGAGPTSFTAMTSNSASVGTNSNTATMAATRAALQETKQAKLGVKVNPVNSNRGSEKLTQDIRSKSLGVKSAPLPFGTAARRDPVTAHHAIPSAYFPKPAPS